MDGECYCRVPNSVELQFGQCMELTVDVTNSSAALSCMWYANNSRQFRNDPSDFFEVRGDRNQVYTSIIFSSTHARTHACTHAHTYTRTHTHDRIHNYLFCLQTCSPSSSTVYTFPSLYPDTDLQARVLRILFYFADNI